MDRTDRRLLIAVTILHVLAQIYLYFNVPTPPHISAHESSRIASPPGVDPAAYRESFQYTTSLYPFLPPDVVWLKRSH